MPDPEIPPRPEQTTPPPKAKPQEPDAFVLLVVPLKRFSMGQMVITANAQAVLTPEDVSMALARHSKCDWGEVCSEDAKVNERGVLEHDECGKAAEGSVDGAGTADGERVRRIGRRGLERAARERHRIARRAEVCVIEDIQRSHIHRDRADEVIRPGERQPARAGLDDAARAAEDAALRRRPGRDGERGGILGRGDGTRRGIGLPIRVGDGGLRGEVRGQQRGGLPDRLV